MGITKQDIEQFYKKYFENTEEELKIQDSVLHAENAEEWADNLARRDEVLQTMYAENEKMIAKYVTPFLEGKEELTEELASTFVEQITEIINRSYNDYMLGVEVGYMLEKFYDQKHNLIDQIRIWHILGAQLARFNDIECLKNSLKFFDKEKQMLSFYKEIEDWQTRRAVLLSPYNYCIVLLYILTYIEDQKEKDRYQAKLLYELVAAIKVYEREDLREIDGDKIDFDEFCRDLKSDICGGWISRMDPNLRIMPDFFAYADYVLTDLYQEEMNHHVDPVDMNEEVYCCYLKCLLLKNKIDRTTFSQKYLDYCDMLLKNCRQNWEDDASKLRYYTVCVYHLTTVLPYVIHEEIPKEKQERLKKYCLQIFFYSLEKIAKQRNREFIHVLINDEVQLLLQYLPEDISPFYFLFRVLVQANEVIMVHTVSVAYFTQLCMKAVMESKPELLIGIFGTKTVEEVKAKERQIFEFSNKASIVFDVGKIKMMDYVGKVTRPLSVYEKNKIYMHPNVGANIINHIDELSNCKDVVLGHHKSFDGRRGYPMEYDPTESEVRMITEIVKFCDELDNATSTNKKFGHQVISFDTFMENVLKNNSYFSKDLIHFIEGHTQLQEQLRRMTSSGRKDIYRKIFKEFLSVETTLDELYKDSIRIGGDNEIDADVRIETVLEIIELLQNKDISFEEKKALGNLYLKMKLKQKQNKSIQVHFSFSE